MSSNFNSIVNWFKSLTMPNNVRKGYDYVVAHTKIVLHVEPSGAIVERSLRDTPWSEEKYFGLGKFGWYCDKIDCSDYEGTDYVGAKSEIHWPMFYCPTNIHYTQNGWPQTTPIMIVDANFHGKYRKDVVVDGNLIHSYHPAADDWSGTSAWIHYNLITGECVDLG